MNGSSWPCGWAPPVATEGESPVSRALAVVFPLQSAPDWKELQAERIRAWRRRAEAGAQAEAPLESAEAGSTGKGGAYSGQPGQQVQEPCSGQPGQQVQEPCSGQQGQQVQEPCSGQQGQQARGQAQPAEGRGLTLSSNQLQPRPGEGLTPHPHNQQHPTSASRGEPRADAPCPPQEGSRHAAAAQGSGDEEEEEACLAPCSDEESQDLPTIEEPGWVYSKKEQPQGSDPALAQKSQPANPMLGENRPLSTSQADHASGLQPDAPCSATVPLRPQQVAVGSSSILKDSVAGLPESEQSGLSQSTPQSEETACLTLREQQPERGAAKSDKPSWALHQAARIKAWHEANRREIPQPTSGLHLKAETGCKEPIQSEPVKAATRFEGWREGNRKRLHELIENKGEQYGLSTNRHQAKHTALMPGSLQRVPAPRPALEPLLSVPQNVEYRKPLELASSRGQQAEQLTEPREYLTIAQLMLDKSWSLQQAVKIGTLHEPASREGSTMLPSCLNKAASIDPKQGAVGSIPMHQIHTGWNSTHRGELIQMQRSPNVEAVHSTNQWPVVKSQHGLEAQIRGKLTVEPSNPNADSAHNINQWVHQGPSLQIGLQAPGREELMVTPSVPSSTGVYGNKWWNVDNKSVHQTPGTAAEWESSSSGTSSLMPRDRNGKLGQLTHDSSSAHQTPGIKPFWQFANIGASNLEQALLNFETMHNRQGPLLKIGLEPQGRRELTVTPSVPTTKEVYDNKWWNVESNSVRQTEETTAEWEASSSSKSSLMPRGHNEQPGQLSVDQASEHQVPGIKPWSISQSDLERTHLNLEAMHSTKRGAVEIMPVPQTPESRSWQEAANRRIAGLLNIGAAHNSKWPTVESIPVRPTTGISSCGKAANTGKITVTWEQTIATSSQHAVHEQPSNCQMTPWPGGGELVTGLANKVQSQHQDLTRIKQGWSFSGRNAAKLQTPSRLSFIESEKKRMQDWAQSVWSQATKQELSLKPMSMQHD